MDVYGDIKTWSNPIKPLWKIWFRTNPYLYPNYYIWLFWMRRKNDVLKMLDQLNDIVSLNSIFYKFGIIKQWQWQKQKLPPKTWRVFYCSYFFDMFPSVYLKAPWNYVSSRLDVGKKNGKKGRYKMTVTFFVFRVRFFFFLSGSMNNP